MNIDSKIEIYRTLLSEISRYKREIDTNHQREDQLQLRRTKELRYFITTFINDRISSRNLNIDSSVLFKEVNVLKNYNSEKLEVVNLRYLEPIITSNNLDGYRLKLENFNKLVNLIFEFELEITTNYTNIFKKYTNFIEQLELDKLSEELDNVSDEKHEFRKILDFDINKVAEKISHYHIKTDYQKEQKSNLNNEQLNDYLSLRKITLKNINTKKFKL